MAGSQKVRRVAVQRYLKGGGLAAVFHITGHAGYVVVELSPDMKSITRIRNPKNLLSDPFEKTPYLAEIAEDRTGRDGATNFFEHRLVRVLSPEDQDLERWRNAESLDGLPVSAEPEMTIEERAWAGEKKGNLTWGILAVLVALGSAAAALGGYFLNVGHWGFAVITAVSLYFVVRYPWKIPRRPSPEKLAELQAYKEKLRPQAEGDLAEVPEMSAAAPAASDQPEEAEVPEASEMEPAASAMPDVSEEPEVPEAEPAASDLLEVLEAEPAASDQPEVSEEPEVQEVSEESKAARADGESADEPAAEAAAEPADEPAAEDAPEPTAEAAPEPADEPADEPVAEPAAWDGLSPERLESSVSTKLETEGFKIKATRFLKDGGIDVEALDEHWAPVVVQVKPHQKNVGVSVVREMIGVREQRPDNPRAIIYSPVGFTRGAKGLAKTSGIELREFDKHDPAPGAGNSRRTNDDDGRLDGRILDA